MRAGDDHIQSPGIGLDIEDPERGDGIHDEDRVLIRLDDFPKGFHIVGHAGRRLARLHIDRFNGRISLQRIGHLLRIDGTSPLDFEFSGLDAECFTELPPAFAKLPAVDIERLVAGGQEV